MRADNCDGENPATPPRVLIDMSEADTYGLSEPVVFPKLVSRTTNTVEWQTGEREEWASTWLNWPTIWETPSAQRMVKAVELMKGGALLPDLESKVIAKGPEDLIRPLLKSWRPKDLEGASQWMKVIIARFGAHAVPATIAIAKKSPAVGAELLRSMAGPGIAGLMADWMVRFKPTRPQAIAWLLRYPAAAATTLIPVAFGKLGPARSAAEEALRFLADHGHHSTIMDTAQGYGEAVFAATEELVAISHNEAPPAWMPNPPKWLKISDLPPITLTNGQPLSESSCRLLCGILALPDIQEIHSRMAAVISACDAASLAAFHKGLLNQWEAGTAPAKDMWVVTAVGFIGDDDSVRDLIDTIVVWAESGKTVRAVKGLEAVGQVGSDIALMHIERLSRTSKHKKLKSRSGELLVEIAKKKKLTHEELTDRVVPSFGLDTNGSMILDYGPRRFTVGFDEQLKPWVAEENGTRRALLPRPSTKDDQSLAPASYKRFAALKKDVRAIASDQIRRLEKVMVSQRRWTFTEFTHLLVNHPLLWHLTRRLVWAEYSPTDGAADSIITTTFRVAEDRSLADIEDDELTLDPDAIVGIPHPVQLDGMIPTWSETFDDYEILQPFPQLDRGVFTFTEQEAQTDRLSRFEEIEVVTGKILGLRSKGWLLGHGSDGDWDRAERDIDGRSVIVELSPGIPPSYVQEYPQQKLTTVRITNSGTTPARFGELTPLMSSEILRDLTNLTS